MGPKKSERPRVAPANAEDSRMRPLSLKESLPNARGLPPRKLPFVEDFKLAAPFIQPGSEWVKGAAVRIERILRRPAKPFLFEFEVLNLVQQPIGLWMLGMNSQKVVKVLRRRIVFIHSVKACGHPIEGADMVRIVGQDGSEILGRRVVFPSPGAIISRIDEGPERFHFHPTVGLRRDLE